MDGATDVVHQLVNLMMFGPLINTSPARQSQSQQLSKTSIPTFPRSPGRQSQGLVGTFADENSPPSTGSPSYSIPNKRPRVNGSRFPVRPRIAGNPPHSMLPRPAFAQRVSSNLEQKQPNTSSAKKVRVGRNTHQKSMAAPQIQDDSESSVNTQERGESRVNKPLPSPPSVQVVSRESPVKYSRSLIDAAEKPLRMAQGTPDEKEWPPMVPEKTQRQETPKAMTEPDPGTIGQAISHYDDEAKDEQKSAAHTTSSSGNQNDESTTSHTNGTQKREPDVESHALTTEGQIRVVDVKNGHSAQVHRRARRVEQVSSNGKRGDSPSTERRSSKSPHRKVNVITVSSKDIPDHQDSSSATPVNESPASEANFSKSMLKTNTSKPLPTTNGVKMLEDTSRTTNTSSQPAAVEDNSSNLTKPLPPPIPRDERYVKVPPKPRGERSMTRIKSTRSSPELSAEASAAIAHPNRNAQITDILDTAQLAKVQTWANEPTTSFNDDDDAKPRPVPQKSRSGDSSKIRQSMSPEQQLRNRYNTLPSGDLYRMLSDNYETKSAGLGGSVRIDREASLFLESSEKDDLMNAISEEPDPYDQSKASQEREPSRSQDKTANDADSGHFSTYSSSATVRDSRKSYADSFTSDPNHTPSNEQRKSLKSERTPSGDMTSHSDTNGVHQDEEQYIRVHRKKVPNQTKSDAARANSPHANVLLTRKSAKELSRRHSDSAEHQLSNFSPSPPEKSGSSHSEDSTHSQSTSKSRHREHSQGSEPKRHTKPNNASSISLSRLEDYRAQSLAEAGKMDQLKEMSVEDHSMSAIGTDTSSTHKTESSSGRTVEPPRRSRLEPPVLPERLSSLRPMNGTSMGPDPDREEREFGNYSQPDLPTQGRMPPPTMGRSGSFRKSGRSQPRPKTAILSLRGLFGKRASRDPLKGQQPSQIQVQRVVNVTSSGNQYSDPTLQTDGKRDKLAEARKHQSATSGLIRRASKIGKNNNEPRANESKTIDEITTFAEMLLTQIKKMPDGEEKNHEILIFQAMINAIESAKSASVAHEAAQQAADEARSHNAKAQEALHTIVKQYKSRISAVAHDDSLLDKPQQINGYPTRPATAGQYQKSNVGKVSNGF